MKTKIIESLNKICVKYEKVFTIDDFSNCYTISELLFSIVEKLNELIGNTNDFIKEFTNLINMLLDEGLKNELLEILNEWVENGKLSDIINQNIFTEFLNKINNFENELGSLDNKIITLSTSVGNITLTLEDFKKILNSKRLQIIGDKNLDDYPVDIKNFGGDRQDLISFCIHNYSDSEGIRVDNVGEGPCLVLKNAHNSVNRPDKPSNFCGNGLFIKLLKSYFDETGSEKTMGILQMDADTRLHMGNDCHINNVAPPNNGMWGYAEKNYHKKPFVKTLINGDDMVENIQYGNTVGDYYTKEYQENIIHKFMKGIARFIHSKKDDGVWGWSFECLNKLKYAFVFKNGEDIAFSIEDEQVNFYYPLRIRPINHESIKYGSCLFVDENDDNKLKFMNSRGEIKEIVLK